MLKAWLHRKVHRPAGDADQIEPERSAEERIFAREDPLTSAVFERLAYLEPAEAWTLLRAAYDEHDRDQIPEVAPSGVPEWSFWPRLSPGTGGFNARCVEPDVIVAWGGFVLIIEAKHWGVQSSAQWVEEILAVRTDRRFASKRLVFIAVGGARPATFADLAMQVRSTLGRGVAAFLLLRWDVLREVAELRESRAAPGAAVILHDLVAALESWGYRRRIGFDSLPRSASKLHIAATSENLKNWRVR